MSTHNGDDGDAEEVPPHGHRHGVVADRLARDFLRAEPGAFFRSRALQLMSAKSGEEPAEWPSTPLAAEVASYFPGESGPGEKINPESVRIIDSFMLAHHAGECLLRHVLGIYDSHDTDRPTSAPSLHMVDPKISAQFRTRVGALRALNTAEFDSLVDFAFMTSQITSPGDDSLEPEESQNVTVFCRSWLRHFAARFIDTARGYNAAKHGLTPLGGPMHLSFHPGPEPPDVTTSAADDGATFVLMDGPALRTLEHESDGQGGRTWFEVTRGVDPAALISTTLIAADLLDWLWAIERGRTTGEAQTVSVRTGPTPSDILGRNTRAWSSWKMPLAAFALGDEEGTTSES